YPRLIFSERGVFGRGKKLVSKNGRCFSGSAGRAARTNPRQILRTSPRGFTTGQRAIAESVYALSDAGRYRTPSRVVQRMGELAIGSCASQRMTCGGGLAIDWVLL